MSHFKQIMTSNHALKTNNQDTTPQAYIDSIKVELESIIYMNNPVFSFLTEKKKKQEHLSINHMKKTPLDIISTQFSVLLTVKIMEISLCKTTVYAFLTSHPKDQSFLSKLEPI